MAETTGLCESIGGATRSAVSDVKDSNECVKSDAYVMKINTVTWDSDGKCVVKMDEASIVCLKSLMYDMSQNGKTLWFTLISKPYIEITWKIEGFKQGLNLVNHTKAIEVPEGYKNNTNISFRLTQSCKDIISHVLVSGRWIELKVRYSMKWHTNGLTFTEQKRK